MKRLVLFTAAILLASTAWGQSGTPQSTVSVTGKAEREVTPNEIFVSIIIDENDMKGSATVSDIEKRMIASLKKLGIDTDKNLEIQDIAGDLQTFLLRRNRVTTTRSYILKVGDSQMLARVFQTFGELNISKARVVRAGYSDVDKVRMELRGEAMRNAQANARALAEGVGQTIGKATSISEYGYYGNDSYIAEQAVAVRSAKADGTEEYISTPDFRKIKISVSVSANFALE